MSAGETTRRTKPVCAGCGSDEVCLDAYAQWDCAAQEWVLASIYDEAFCTACDGETKLAIVDLISGEALDYLPNGTLAPAPEAEVAWQAYFSQQRARRAAEQAERQAMARALTNAEALAAGQEVSA